MATRTRTFGRIAGLTGMTLALVTGMAAAPAPAPAAAAARTLWVDDDGTSGAKGCSGDRRAHRRIQVAIEVATQGDTIKVCPGIYAERLEITGRLKNGLTVESVVKHGATIVWPAEPDDAGAFDRRGLVTVTSNGVTIRRLRILIAPNDTRCGGAIGVRADTGGRLTLAGLRIEALEGSVDGAPCVASGIGASAIQGATIQNNVLTGVGWGITTSGATLVTGNTVRARQTMPPSHGTACQGEGIAIHGDSPDGPAIVRGNTVIQDLPSGDAEPRRLCEGILASGWTTLSGNRVEGPMVGISTSGRGLTARNTIVGTQWVGLSIGQTGRAEVRDNRVTGSLGDGLSVSGWRNRIHGNDLRGNAGLDCSDGSEPQQSDWEENFGTGNRWWDNLGHDASPRGICKRRIP